ncbi:uncharacterized protein [Watersipora subatra]|uniref:uncharacterized protein n=1 Tax=Watersipora subatra TaxID=2589382 RepID=UPI00355BB140
MESIETGITSLLYQHRKSVIASHYVSALVSTAKPRWKDKSAREIKQLEGQLHRHLGLIRKKGAQPSDDKPFIKERTFDMKDSKGDLKAVKTATRSARTLHDSKSKVKVQDRSIIDVIVVEEHHEVLAYWFEQAKISYVGEERKRTPYTVVHFDAHSDFGPLSYYPSLTLFSWPKSQTDILKLMQRNDVFIMAGMATGLITRFIWIWPNWMQEDYADLYGNHTTGLVDLGTFTYKEEQAATKTGMCVCFKQVQKDGKTSKAFVDELKRNCLYAKPELEPYMLDGVKCSVKRANVRFDFLSERHIVLQRINISAMLLKESLSRVIVDIDEDYFGCENSEEILHASGIDSATLEEMNDRLLPLFCPKTSNEEKKLSMLIPTLLAADCMQHKRSCLSSAVFTANRQSLCTNVTDFNENFQRLRAFTEKELKEPRLRSVVDFGFCMRTSPNTAKVVLGIEKNAMRVCLKEGTSTTRSLFKPTRKEILKNSLKVQQILQGIDGVQQVTIARSNRDGFVARSLQKEIEQTILQMIGNLCRGRHVKPNIIYDSNLMYN